MSRNKAAWDPETMGFGKHSYRQLDVDTANAEDFAVDLRGEQQHRGDVREYNSANNEMHDGNSLTS